MIATAKVFNAGNSQAIRLPKAFRLDTDEVWISKSSDGVLTVKPKPQTDDLEAFLDELRAMPPSDEFLQPRDDAPRASPFEGWNN